MKKIMQVGNWFLISLITIYACEVKTSDDLTTVSVEPLENRLPQNDAGEILSQAIAQVGGWEKWMNKNYFSFYKKITSVDSLGVPTRTLRQLHQYQLQPEFRARMSWEEDGVEHLIINNGSEARKYEAGKWQTDKGSKDYAWNSSFGSHYVISMPFKLTDPGAKLIYEGVDSTTLSEPAHAIKVEYEEGAGSAGGMHTWWYYFDLNNFDLVANFLDYGDKYSLTIYESFTTVGGIRMHRERKSYSSNVNKEKLLLRTIYTNEEMQFVDKYSADLFVFD